MNIIIIVMSDFNISPLILEINTIVKSRLESYIKEYNSTYELLEKTHKELMELPFVNKTRQSCNAIVKTEKKNIEEEITKNITEPLVLEVEKMIKNGLNKILADKKERYELLENTQKSILEILITPKLRTPENLPQTTDSNNSDKQLKENIQIQKIEHKSCTYCSRG